MTDYTITTDFGAKDSLPSGNAAKVIKGSEFTTEFTNIKTAVNSKADTAGDTFTGAVTFDADVTLNADVTFDTNTMFVDVSANRVGIGNVAPATALDVTGVITTDGLTSSADIDITGTVTASGLTVDTNTLHVDATNDKVGIGTTSPTGSYTTALHIHGSSTGASLHLTDPTSGATASDGLEVFQYGTDGYIWEREAGNLRFGTSATERMRIDSSGKVGIGTSSPSAPLHVNGGVTGSVIIDGTDSIRPSTNSSLITISGGNATNIGANYSLFGGSHVSLANVHRWRTGGSESMRIDSSGNVGIGTSSPNQLLSLNSTASTARGISIDQAGAERVKLLYTNSSGSFDINNTTTGYTSFSNNGSERMRIDSSGNVGIGTSSPDDKFHVANGSTGAGYLRIANNEGYARLGTDGGNLLLDVGGSEKVRIDSSGNVLVGKTASSLDTTGIQIQNNGLLRATTSGADVLQLNRQSTDGVLANFYKDGTTVGSIRTRAAFLNIGSGDTGLLFNSTSDRIQPESTTGGARDAAIDIGGSSTRFKDIYRSGSTYSTSDRNKKQDIRDLTDAEARVATVAKGSLKAFRYIDTVEAEGDDANIHFGIIAQDLKAAFEAEGLNADSYQVLKTSTYTDDDGVEQTTYSVCYENLLAFIISAI